jgi:predicted phage baseplate assembly protein
MSLTPPTLDDRSFEQLFQEARGRIPLYLPEWTDWNESDPGITLLQLHAWLTETVLVRLAQVPDLHFVKFLELIGGRLRPARPATAVLSFTLNPRLKQAF